MPLPLLGFRDGVTCDYLYFSALPPVASLCCPVPAQGRQRREESGRARRWSVLFSSNRHRFSKRVGSKLYAVVIETLQVPFLVGEFLPQRLT